LITKGKAHRALAAAVALLFAPAAHPQESHDWLTWGGDPGRSGWAKTEKTLSKDNAARLKLKWTAQLDITPKFEVLSTSTAPLVATNIRTTQGPRDLVFVVAADSTVYAIDAASGKVVWKRPFPNNLQPKTEATYLCPNTQNTTPVIDKEHGTLYVLTSDGKLRGLSLGSGDEVLTPSDFVPPFARTWSLNLIDGVIYTPVGRGCGGTMSNFAAMDISRPDHSQVHFYTSVGRPAGAWGRGGMVLGPKGLYAQTADGPYDPAAGKFGNTLLVLSRKDLRLVDSFTPADSDYLNKKDLDLGSASPIVFPFQKWQLIATAAKQAEIYLLDANQVGGADHRTPLYHARFGNDQEQLWGRGLWGSMSTWEDAAGNRWLIMPMWGPPRKDGPNFEYTYGDAERGSVMAFRVVVENDKPSLAPVWRSRDMHVPDPPVIANGVVFSVATGENTRQGGYFPAEVRAKPVGHAILYAFDATTGKELYSSGDAIESFVHFGGLAVANGQVYLTTWDGKVYAFGIN
jgi:outer membrane protein assembly factor BamB